jgi:hypothetical protein
MKICKKCLIEKPLLNFSKHPKTKDKLQPKCKNCESEQNKIARQKHPNSKYYQQNKQYYQEYGKNWKLEHPDKWKKWHNQWQKDRNKLKYDTDPLYKLRMCVGTRIRLALKSQNKVKLGKTIDYLGCDYSMLKQHIENQFTEGMNWGNYGKWEIDHIIPVSKNGSLHYTNLQPLWKLDNLKKSNKILGNIS